MIKKISIGDVSWIDIQNPISNEIEHLCDELNIPDFIKNELLPKILKSKIERYDDGTFLVLHFPYPGSSRDKSQELEVDFLIHKNYLVTLHYSKLNTINEFSFFLEHKIAEKNNSEEINGGVLFYEFLKIFYQRIYHRLLDFNSRLHKIETEIFEGRENNAVKLISQAKRTLLDFKQSLRFHRDILVSLEEISAENFGKDYRRKITRLIAEHSKLQNMMDSHKEILNDLHMTNDSLMTTKTNDVMKKLTIMAFITFPLSLLAAIFGMNTENTPILGIPNDFWAIILLMIMGVLGMLLYFKHKKWL